MSFIGVGVSQSGLGAQEVEELMGVHGCLDSWFPPPWQAAAGFGGSSLEVLIHGLDLLPAVAAAQPAGVAMGVAGDEVEDGQQAEPFASEVLGRTGHLS